MNKTNAIVPVVIIDEEAEFAALEKQTRRHMESATMEAIARETAKNEQLRCRNERRRKAMKNVQSFFCGIAATTSLFGTIIALNIAPLLAVFPATLCCVSLLKAVCTWNR